MPQKVTVVDVLEEDYCSRRVILKPRKSFYTAPSAHTAHIVPPNSSRKNLLVLFARRQTVWSMAVLAFIPTVGPFCHGIPGPVTPGPVTLTKTTFTIPSCHKLRGAIDKNALSPPVPMRTHVGAETPPFTMNDKKDIKHDWSAPPVQTHSMHSHLPMAHRTQAPLHCERQRRRQTRHGTSPFLHTQDYPTCPTSPFHDAYTRLSHPFPPHNAMQFDMSDALPPPTPPTRRTRIHALLRMVPRYETG